MNRNNKIILGIGIITSFALLIFSISLYLNYIHETKQKERLEPETIERMSKEEIINYLEERRASENSIRCFYLLPFIAFAGILVGTLTYYIMSEKVNKQEKTLKNNTEIILSLLTKQEKKVVETLLKNNGEIRQYELSHLPNLNKVKTHRILSSLEQKNIIKKEKIGKVNKVILNQELYRILK